jgi:hypothetical protein
MKVEDTLTLNQRRASYVVISGGESPDGHRRAQPCEK